MLAQTSLRRCLLKSACLPEVRHSHPTLLLWHYLSPSEEKQQRVVLGVGSGLCGQATIWGRRSGNDTEEVHIAKVSYIDLKLLFLLI